MKKIILTTALGTFFIFTVFSQGSKIPLIGAKAPSFTAQTTNGKITFPDGYGKKWKILFSHPQDFTPVCSSELLELASMQKEFETIGVQIAIISTDDIEKHKLWKKWLEELDYKGRGLQKIEFPIIDDHLLLVSKAYGMLHSQTSSKRDIRGVFIIDPSNIVRSVDFYPMQVGRNMEEFKRIIVALQTVDSEKVYTPANWEIGQDVIVPRYPYTDSELANNPELKDDFYKVGDYLWFKKAR